MNRREFTKSLAAAFTLPALPLPAISAAQPVTVTKAARFWAIYMTHMHGDVTPGMLTLKALTPKALPFLDILGKLAMADVFLIAVYIVVAKGVGVGRIETAWGLYLFTICVAASMIITYQTKKNL